MVAQLVRAFALNADGWMFESQLWQTQIVKTGSDSSTAKCSALSVSVTGPWRWHKQMPHVTGKCSYTQKKVVNPDRFYHEVQSTALGWCHKYFYWWISSMAHLLCERTFLLQYWYIYNYIIFMYFICCQRISQDTWNGKAKI